MITAEYLLSSLSYPMVLYTHFEHLRVPGVQMLHIVLIDYYLGLSFTSPLSLLTHLPNSTP